MRGLVIGVALAVVSCGRQVTGMAVNSREEVRMTAVRSDTVMVRDTVTLTVTPAGDTVGRERVRMVYKRQTVHDTVMMVRGDTVVIREKVSAPRSWRERVKEWVVGAVAGLAVIGAWRLVVRRRFNPFRG